jgi:hypothetical protein
MWKKLVAGAIAVLAVVLFTLPAPAFADWGRSHRFHNGDGRWDRHHGHRYSGHPPKYSYGPPARYNYYAPPRRYYAPAPRYGSYSYRPYRPDVEVQFFLPFPPFFSFYLR